MTPIDTSPEALAAAVARRAATQLAAEEASQAERAAHVAYFEAQKALWGARSVHDQAIQAARLLESIRDATPGTAVPLGPHLYAWRLSDGMPRCTTGNGRAFTAQYTTQLGPGAELEAWVHGGRKWRPVAEVRAGQMVARWRVKQ
jgi:hypothetical protein